MAADDLLAGLADVEEVSAEAAPGAQIEQQLELPVSTVSRCFSRPRLSRVAFLLRLTPPRRRAPGCPYLGRHRKRTGGH